MIDIHFYMKVFDLKSELMNGVKKAKEYVFEMFEEYRSKDSIIYNIETTNACNMICEMCPRTTMMTREIETLDMETFKSLIDQIRPFSESECDEWERFVERNYNISKDDMCEDHFFLYIIPRVLVLHGYGDPLLDKYMPERVKFLTQKNIPSYFSCNPTNIDVSKTARMFEEGLDFVKFSIESADDLRHKEVRGEKSNFSESYKKILQLLNLKEKKKYETVIVITMLNLNKDWQEEEYEKVKDAFKDLDVYIYLKSQDQNWYKDNKLQTKSLHWTEYCQFPWTSLTVKSNGEIVMCVEDFNNEIILGNAKKEPLIEIWNGQNYLQFRHDQFNLKQGIKCTEQCDMKLIGSFVN